jgi:Na+/proline symporter
MGAMLYAVSLTMKAVLNLTPAQYLMMLVGLGLFTTIYTAAGGLGAVVWTDVFQSATLGLAAVTVLYLAVHGISGGWSGLWTIGNEHDKFTLIHLELLVPNATSIKSPLSIYTAVAFAVFMYLPGYAVSQNMILRYVCSGTIADARRVVVLSALVNVAMGFLLLLLGVSFYVYYSQPGGPGMPPLDRQDQILPHFITRAGVPGLTGLVMAGMFAAASAMDSGINGVASVLCYDWLGGRQLPVRVSRMLTMLLGCLVIGVALAAPVLGDNVLNIVNTIAGTMLGALMPVFLLGMFSRGANSGGVLIGLAISATCLGTVLAARNIPASWYLSAGLGSFGGSPVVQALAGIPSWWYGAIVIIPGLIVGHVASNLFPRPSPAALQGTFTAVRKGMPA